MTKNEDISNPFEVTERKTLAVQNIVDKNKYSTILFFSPHYTQLDTCPKFHPDSDNQIIACLSECFYIRGRHICGPHGGNRCTCNAMTMYVCVKHLCIVYHDGNM